MKRIKALFLLFNEVTPLIIKSELKCVSVHGLVDIVYDENATGRSSAYELLRSYWGLLTVFKMCRRPIKRH